MSLFSLLLFIIQLKNDPFFAFNIVNSVTGKTLDIIEDRKPLFSRTISSSSLLMKEKRSRSSWIFLVPFSASCILSFLMLRLYVIDFIMSDSLVRTLSSQDLMPVLFFTISHCQINQKTTPTIL